MREEYTTDPDQTYEQYATQVGQDFIPQQLPVTAVTNINGAAGPNVNFSSPDGFSFSPAGSDVVFSVSNGATARAALGAAKSGANDNINTFTALTGNTGWTAWTGTPDKTAHATYPASTASVGYVAAELQAVMDKLKQITEAYKALQDVLLGIGITAA